MAEICVWTGGTRNVLNPFDRIDGYPSAVKDDEWPWTVNETGGNHRVIRVPGDWRDFLYLRFAQVRLSETQPNKFEEDPIGRCRWRIAADMLKRRNERIIKVSRKWLEDNSFCAPNGPTMYMSEEERSDWFKSRRRARMGCWLGTTAIARPN